MVISTISDEKNEKKKSGSEIFSEMDKHNRRNCLSCLNLSFFGLGLLIAGGLAIATAVAATGIITIPVLSSLVYLNPPEPNRLVMPQPYTIESLIKNSILNSNGEASETVTEGQLTALVTAENAPSFRQAEIMVDPNKISFYGYFMNVPFGNPVVIQAGFGVNPEDGNICQLNHASIGRLNLPKWTNAITSPTVCSMLTTLLRTQGIIINKIDTSQGSAKIHYSYTSKEKRSVN